MHQLEERRGVQNFDVSQSFNAIDVEGSTIVDVTMKMTADLASTLASDIAQKSGLTNAITNALDQEATVKQENPVAAAFTALGEAYKNAAEGLAKVLSVPASAAQNIMMFVVIGIAFVIYSFFSFGGVETINRGVDAAAASQGIKMPPRPPPMMPMGMPYPMGMPMGMPSPMGMPMGMPMRPM